MDLLVPTGIVEDPAGLLDPKGADLAPDDRVPILLAVRAVGQAVVAEAEVCRDPRLQLRHQVGDVEHASRQETCVSG